MNQNCSVHPFTINDTDRFKLLETKIVEIIEGDKSDIDLSDIVIVNHTKPSDGTAMEIIYAWERKKVILTIVHGEYSPWITYHSTQLFNSLKYAIQHLKSMRREYEQTQ